MGTELVINPRLAQYVVQTMGRLLATFAVLQGIFIIIGGSERWSGPGFATALQLPGAPPSWGAILLLCGVSAIVGSFRCKPILVAVSHFCGAGWSVFFAFTFVLTALQNEKAATTGIWAYSLIAFMYVIVGAAYRQSKKLEKHAVHRHHA